VAIGRQSGPGHRNPGAAPHRRFAYAAAAEPIPRTEGNRLAKPNYAFAKRQRDLAKQQKKAEKLKRKAEAATPPAPPPPAEDQPADATNPRNSAA
jgi:hypothetical protein